MLFDELEGSILLDYMEAWELWDEEHLPLFHSWRFNHALSRRRLRMIVAPIRESKR